MAAIQKLWKETVAEFYPEGDEEEGEDPEGKKDEKKPEPPENFPEERIDALLKQKMFGFFVRDGSKRKNRKSKVHST